MARIETTRVAQMATWPIWGLQEWPRWLPGHDGTTRVAKVATWPDGNYSSGPDGNMAKIRTTRVAQMATWPGWGLTEWVI